MSTKKRYLSRKKLSQIFVRLTILSVKLTLHVILTAIPVFLCSLCGVIVLRPTVWTALLIFLLPLLYVVFSACFGLFLNLQRPNLKWTSEIIPIKQI